jgi:prephenate dehydratase
MSGPLLSLIDEAMTDIEKSTGFLASVQQVQAWLREHHQLDVGLEDVKRNGDIVREVRQREEQEDDSLPSDEDGEEEHATGW